MSTDARYFDFNPYKLPPDLLQAIGLVITSAAQTESLVQDIIAGCLGVDMEYGRSITTHMTMPLRYSVLRSVAEISVDDLDTLDELDLLIEEIDDAFKGRNAVAHSQWARDPNTGELFTIKENARTRFELDLTPMTIKEVQAVAERIYDAGLRLMQFMGEKQLLPPFPPIRPREHKSKQSRKKRRQQLNT